MEQKQTALDWLVDNLHYLHSTKWNDILQQAKEMEKEQIINAWKNGDGEYDKPANLFAKQYYKKTYGSK